MLYPIYTVDAFTDHIFGGNPAAVCPLESWLPAATMQQLANENKAVRAVPVGQESELANAHEPVWKNMLHVAP